MKNRVLEIDIPETGKCNLAHWGHAVGYDWDPPSTSYSHQIHFIPMNDSSPAVIIFSTHGMS